MTQKEINNHVNKCLRVYPSLNTVNPRIFIAIPMHFEKSRFHKTFLKYFINYRGKKVSFFYTVTEQKKRCEFHICMSDKIRMDIGGYGYGGDIAIDINNFIISLCKPIHEKTSQKIKIKKKVAKKNKF